jgi:hypothetical protein
VSVLAVPGRAYRRAAQADFLTGARSAPASLDIRASLETAKAALLEAVRDVDAALARVVGGGT